MHDDDYTAKRVLSVSELIRDIKGLLEARYPFIWVSGEISNFRMPVSGHFYFTLKDEYAQISAVMFRGQNRNLKFQPEDGLHITGLGRISVYEPRGTFQIILEYIEPKGIGALQIAFEQLKARLGEEGLFDVKYKKPLPFLPRKISIITSPTGAVVHDIITIVTRRFPGIHLEVIPVKVQGDGSDIEIVDAIELMNQRASSDLAILARGGGSLEDFKSFNSEIVARAIFNSVIPIISAVGHETDFTIADFVADLRAPTPSAAAELAVPVRDDLKNRSNTLLCSLGFAFNRYIKRLKFQFEDIKHHLVHPKRKIQDLRLKIDDLSSRMIRSFTHNLILKQQRIGWLTDHIYSRNPMRNMQNIKLKLEYLTNNLLKNKQLYIHKRSMMIREMASKLESLNPSAVLSRGYSITRTIPEARVIRSSDDVSVNQDVEVVLFRGSLVCRIEGKIPNGSQKDV